MKKYTPHSGFTLVELIVSIMIFSIMMVSVLSIFLFSSQMSARVELNRVMQENIKNIIEDIAEDVRKEKIQGVSIAIDDSCSSVGVGNVSSKFCTSHDGGKNQYALGEYVVDKWLPIQDIPVGNIQNKCGNVDSLCRIIKSDDASGYYPLTNSFIHFENISFVVSNTDIPRVTINITARPTYNKGLSPNIIENNTMHIQTTISERLIETN